MRIAIVARDVELWAREAGPETAQEVLRRRRGRAYDPDVADAEFTLLLVAPPGRIPGLLACAVLFDELTTDTAGGTPGAAAVLDISVKTVGAHVEHLYVKAGVRSRAAATLFAMQHDGTRWGSAIDALRTSGALDGRPNASADRLRVSPHSYRTDDPRRGRYSWCPHRHSRGPRPLRSQVHPVMMTEVVREFVSS